VKGVVDRFSEEFVETRRKALDKFLKRITDHPVLSFNEHFNVFLTAKVRTELCIFLPQMIVHGFLS
jgi:sorting nexin-7/30